MRSKRYFLHGKSKIQIPYLMNSSFQILTRNPKEVRDETPIYIEKEIIGSKIIKFRQQIWICSHRELKKLLYLRKEQIKPKMTCKSFVKGELYMPPDDTVMTRASGEAFSNKGISNSVMVYVPATFTAKLNSSLSEHITENLKKMNKKWKEAHNWINKGVKLTGTYP